MPPPIHYRPIIWSDYAGCKALFQDVFDISEDFRFPIAWNNRKDRGSYVATYYGVIIGFSLADNENCIRYITVSKHFQNQKIGTYLLFRTCEALFDAPSIWLTTAGDVRLSAWYEKFGFVHERTYLSKKKEYLGECMIRRQRGRRSCPPIYTDD